MSDEVSRDVLEAVTTRLGEMHREIADAINACVRDLPVMATMSDHIRDVVLGALDTSAIERASGELDAAKAEIAKAQSQAARERIGMRSV